jgi:GAF domain-containing protein
VVEERAHRPTGGVGTTGIAGCPAVRAVPATHDRDERTVSTSRPGDAAPADPVGRPTDRDRLAAVRRLEASAVGSGGLHRLAAIAARLLGTASTQVSLLGDVQTVAGGAGLVPGAIGARSPLAESLCTVTAAQAPEPLVIADAPTDPRVAALPPVTSGAVGSYLGLPLTGPDGTVVGALCVFDRQPRAWSDGDVGLLRELSDSVATELELAALSREYEADRLRFELAIAAAEIGSFDWDLITGAADLGRPAGPVVRLRPRHVRRDDRGVPRPPAP